MIFRRIARPVTVLLAIWCLWVIFRTKSTLIIPVISDFPVENAAELPVFVEAPVEPIPDITANTKPRSRIAKVTVAANTLNSSIIQQALKTHKVQNDIHGYTQFVAASELVSDLSENDPQHRPRGAWSKPAYLLSIVVAELTKPESERLEWVFWFDADTIVMNPHTPLEIFLPPDNMSEVSKIRLLMASNWDGLNSGAFALRIHSWSVSLLSAVLAYPIYNAQKLKTDRFRDQSAFQWLLQAKDSPLASAGFNGRNNWDHWVTIPMRWFNSLPINNAFSKKEDWIFNHNMTTELFDNGTNVVFNDGKGTRVQPWKVMQGDMVVHFAGANPVRDSWMGPWLKRAEANLPEWSNATKQEDLRLEAQQFWNVTAERMIWERGHQSQMASERYKVKQTKKSVTGVAGSMLQPTKVIVGKVPPPSAQKLRQPKVNGSKLVNESSVNP